MRTFGRRRRQTILGFHQNDQRSAELPASGCQRAAPGVPETAAEHFGFHHDRSNCPALPSAPISDVFVPFAVPGLQAPASAQRLLVLVRAVRSFQVRGAAGTKGANAAEVAQLSRFDGAADDLASSGRN